ncbi:MAG: ABC transporter ATP-binding protein [Chloroflexi bacterium]|nr:ABC transporter ATP-binding protein [Chloroflexota bacterium]
MSTIHCQQLVRRFNHVTAVAGVDLDIASGEIYGLIGPDGAGKTTTLRMLAGVLRPTSGRVEVAGFDVARSPESIRHLVGYMPQHFSLYGDLSVRENLEFYADIFGVTGHDRRERIGRLLRFARLEQFQTRAAAKLSGGMKKKLALACALIHQPQVLLLDEPTNGVDPVSRREFWDILSELHVEGVTILVTTPYMDEAERCQRVGLMHRGKIIRQGEPEALRRLVPGEMLAVYAPDPMQAEAILPRFPDYLGHQVYGDRLHVFVADAVRTKPQLEQFLQAEGVPFTRIYPDEPRLEEAFIHIIEQARSE